MAGTTILPPPWLPLFLCRLQRIGHRLNHTLALRTPEILNRKISAARVKIDIRFDNLAVAHRTGAVGEAHSGSRRQRRRVSSWCSVIVIDDDQRRRYLPVDVSDLRLDQIDPFVGGCIDGVDCFLLDRFVSKPRSDDPQLRFKAI